MRGWFIELELEVLTFGNYRQIAQISQKQSTHEEVLNFFVIFAYAKI
jgi:hypothetical protein